MPWPVTHILIAEALYDSRFSHLDFHGFILGTSFPDIRYPAKVDRGLTHLVVEDIAAIQGQISFRAGMMLHHFVDKLWNQFFLEDHRDLFERIPYDRSMIHTMKILQDRYLYIYGNHWGKISEMFNKTCEEEFQIGISGALIEDWHQMLKHYLVKPPQIEDINMLYRSLTAELVTAIQEYYIQYQNNQHLIKRLYQFYEHVINKN
jgi:hypothetical protein